jgi:hypothetical protein
MAFSTSVQPVQKPETTTPGNNITDGLLTALLFAAYTGYMSKKAMRKLKRKLAWTALKMKVQNLFQPRTASDRTLLLVILLIVAVAIVLINPIAALVATLIVLLLYLAGVI